MSDGTSLLFDLPGFRVVSCEEDDTGVRRVVVMQVADEHSCPRCGALAGSRPYDLGESRIKDLPFGQRRLLVIWRKRRYRCAEPRCSQRVFTERSAQVPPRCRLTGRLRARLEQAASRSARAISDVAPEYGSLASGPAGQPGGHRGPAAAAHEQLGRRGRRADPAWAHRRLLLTAGDRLSARGLARLRHVLAVDDPSNEIGAAWAVKDLLRQLLAAPTPHDARHRLFRFYDAVLDADMPETTRLAETISTWWPAIEAFLKLRVPNARTEGSNRVIKQLKRVGCG